MTLRDELQSAIEDLTEREALKDDPEATEKRRQLNESARDTHKGIYQELQVIAKAMPGVQYPGGCYVMGIPSKCLHFWEIGRFIALTESGLLVSVYKDPTNAKKAKGRTETVINVTRTTPMNLDKYFGPLLDWEQSAPDS